MKIYRIATLLGGLYIIIVINIQASEKINSTYEKERRNGADTQVDRLVLNELQKENIESAALSSDAVFLRRIYQDLTGSIPDLQTTKSFLNDKSPNKRAKLIDSLMKTEGYCDYWTLKWGDLLRVKSEFPVNLWPNATQAYHRWIYNAIKTNMPYDEFARKLLLASGSNFRNPEANFYRALANKTPEGFATVAMLTFMGTRFEKWPDAERENITNFFSKVKYKSTNEWKEEIVYTDFNPGKTIFTKLPNGELKKITADEDPRDVFVNWLVSADNPWFARCAVNRIWYWLMGRGIINEADDIMADSEPSNRALLNYLEQEFIKSGFNTQHIIRLIVNSDTYQQSFIPRSKSPRAEALFAYYIVQRLDAEIIIDIIDSLGAEGQKEKYISLIPEPFTYVPVENQTISLSDGSISSQFLSNFGRPARDTGRLSERQNVSSDSQRLFMLNSNYVNQKLWWAIKKYTLQQPQALSTVYLLLLNRYPSAQEEKTIGTYFKDNKINSYQIVSYTFWALLNSKEFLYHH
ncbi:MAG: DUF1553 domain-containing protein, partial [Victivallaceae bacterium]